jgi:hypothetical protein
MANAMPKKIKAKKHIQRRQKVGIAGAPTDKGWDMFKMYFHYDVDAKDALEVTKNFIKTNWSKDDYKAILANPKYEFTQTHIAAICYWSLLENEFPDRYKNPMEYLNNKFNKLIEPGKTILANAAAAAKIKETKFVITPQMRMKQKVLDTVMEDLYLLEDNWLTGGKPLKINLYKQMQVHDIKRFEEIEGWINEYLVDYKLFLEKDEYILESYAHLTRKDVQDRVKILEGFEADVASFKASKKAVRKVTIKKIKGADKQVAKLKYQKQNAEYKLTSLNPLKVPSSMHIYLFNTKNKELTVLHSMFPDGMTVSGSTVKGFDPETSVKISLRKPGDVIPIILKKSVKQIDKMVDNLTTKPKKANGRINENMVILQCK